MQAGPQEQPGFTAGLRRTAPLESGVLAAIFCGSPRPRAEQSQPRGTGPRNCIYYKLLCQNQQMLLQYLFYLPACQSRLSGVHTAENDEQTCHVVVNEIWAGMFS